MSARGRLGFNAIRSGVAQDQDPHAGSITVRTSCPLLFAQPSRSITSLSVSLCVVRERLFRSEFEVRFALLSCCFTCTAELFPSHSCLDAYQQTLLMEKAG